MVNKGYKFDFEYYIFTGTLYLLLRIGTCVFILDKLLYIQPDCHALNDIY